MNIPLPDDLRLNGKSARRQIRKPRMQTLYADFTEECKRCGISLAEFDLWDALGLNGKRRKARDRIMASDAWYRRPKHVQ